MHLSYLEDRPEKRLIKYENNNNFKIPVTIIYAPKTEKPANPSLNCKFERDVHNCNGFAENFFTDLPTSLSIRQNPENILKARYQRLQHQETLSKSRKKGEIIRN